MKITTLIVWCLLFLASFQYNNACLQLRFKNSTGKDLIELKVWTPDGYITLKNLKRGETSPAYTVSSSYKFAHSTAITNSGTFTTPGFCKVGETNYTQGEMIMEFLIKPGSDQNGSKEDPYLFINAIISGGQTNN